MKLFIWPPETDTAHALRYPDGDLSALYVGDYDRRYLKRGIIRNSLYSRKILILDPFIYPLKVKPQYSPLHEPDQHRTQTLRNTNLFFELLPLSDAPLRVLNNIELRDALRLRLDGRLDSMRGFLNQAWRRACSDQPFRESNAAILAAELQDEIRKAEVDWEQIEIDSRSFLFTGAAATLATGASAAFSLASAGFLAAAGLAAMAGGIAVNNTKRRQHAMRYPAAFFLNIDDDDR
jgi:hypothetical protein